MLQVLSKKKVLLGNSGASIKPEANIAISVQDPVLNQEILSDQEIRIK